MDVNDTQGNGPDQEPTVEGPTTEGPQAPAGDQPTAEQPSAEQPSAGGQAPKRLTRTRADRVIGGVCGGLGRYFNVDPLLFRIGAVALVFLGGAGILLYLAALLLVPNEDQPAPIAPGAQGRNRALVIAGVVALLIVAWPFLLFGGALFAGVGIPLAVLVGAGVLVWWLVSGEGPSGSAGDIARRAALGVAVVIGCFILFFVAGFGAGAGPDWLVPALVVAAGAAIAAGAFLKPVRWLVPPAMTIALAAGVVAAADIDFDGGIGQREYRPGSSVDLRDHYDLGIGELVVDLRDTDLPKGDVPLDLDVGIGEARVIVPDDVCVATNAEVGAGNIAIFGRDHGGIDAFYENSPTAKPTTTRLLLHADVGMGEVRVNDSRGELYFDDREFGPFHDEDPELNDQPAACATTG
jgi:phage shock protein PspC (stress-responsive transcriptional regulator)